MAEERRKVKDTDVDAKKSSKDTGETEVVDDDQEFSIFDVPKPKKPAAMPQQTRPTLRHAHLEEPVAEVEDIASEAEVEAPVEEVVEVIDNKQFTPSVNDQQSQLDDVRQNFAPVFVDKKDKELEKNLAAEMKAKTSKGDDSIIPTADGKDAEVVETPTDDIIKGKLAVKEQHIEPQKGILAPGSKQEQAHLQETLTRQAGEIKNALGSQEPNATKTTKETKESPNTNSQKLEKPISDEHKIKKQEAPIDPRTVAYIPAEALPKEKNEIAVNSEQPIQKAPLTTKLQEIVDQIVKEIYTLNDDGGTETTIILQNPPLFSGVKVVIETFKNAPNQLNITFTDLTGPGKRLLDENLASLKVAIESNDKGMIVQQLTTTTLSEIPRYVSDAQPQKDRDQQGQGQQQGSNKEQSDDQDKDEKKRK